MLIEFDPSNVKIDFFPDEHKYVINGKEVISVTQLLAKHHISNYGSYVSDAMKEAMAYGTFFHKEAEAVWKGLLQFNEMFSKEAEQFKEWYLALPFKPIYAELILHYGEVFAGTCDMIYRDKDEKLVLVDYKTGTFKKKEHTWQLNLYRVALATMGIFIDRMEIWCFKDSTIYQIDNLSDDEIYELLAAEQTNRIYGEDKEIVVTKKSSKELKDIKNAFKKIRKAALQAEQIEKDLKKLKQSAMDYMKKNGGNKLTSEIVNFTFVAPKDKDSFDSKKFAKDHPDLHKLYSYKTPVTPYVKLAWVKDKEEKKA